uniref:Ig-like domain-containing protein n=1 Tax=Takifugu rubripes TaxID=31033 RepID=A0A3B5KCL9_TAKRU
MFAGQPVLPLLLLAAVSYAAEQTVFCPVGDTITLSLVLPMSERISRILWKYDRDMVADWTHGHFLSYGRFKDRTTVDNTTGLLEIRSGMTEDSGRYEMEVNNRLHDLVYEVKVIKRVPKPIVWIQPLKCCPSSLQCTLSCDGSTEGAEPITYSWASAKLFPITNNTANVATFSCRMENPISHQESDPKANPFFPEDKSRFCVAQIWNC